MDESQQVQRRTPFPRWGHFLCLLQIFFLASVVATSLPTPGEWSDYRSQWMPSAALATVSLVLCVATHWLYRRPSLLFKLQAIALWLLFGYMCGESLLPLYESATFFRELHRRHEMRQSNLPNQPGEPLRWLRTASCLRTSVAPLRSSKRTFAEEIMMSGERMIHRVPRYEARGIRRSGAKRRERLRSAGDSRDRRPPPAAQPDHFVLPH